MIGISFRRQSFKKNTKSRDILGCSFEELQQHLEMTCIENYGVLPDDLKYVGIHIDHIIPVSSTANEQELYDLNHFSNLQYLTAEDNLKKGDRYE